MNPPQIIESENLGALIVRVWPHISKKRKKHFGLLLFLMIIAAITEVISLGAVLPFLGVFTAPERVFSNQYLHLLFNFFGLMAPSDILIPITIIFCLAALVSGCVRILLIWATTKISYATGAELSSRIYRKTLYQPYSLHVSRNSSEIISGISSKSDSLIHSLIMPVLNLITGCVILLMIMGTLLLIEPVVSLVAFFSFAIIYMIIMKFVSRRLQRNSKQISEKTTQVIKSLQEGLGGIRDVLLDGSQEYFCETYQKADKALRVAQGENQFIATSPRYAMEAMGMVLISILAYMLTKGEGGISSAIPILGVIALGAQRLLPIVQQQFNSWSSIVGSKGSLADALILLEQPLPNFAGKKLVDRLTFENRFELCNVFYGYSSSSNLILNGVDLVIPKGSRVGFIGRTGSGKSTMLDIIMGLIRPISGTLKVDGVDINEHNCKNWQNRIAHVPQSIYLADSTIAENIAFGVPKNKIDYQRVESAAEQAQIASVICSMEKKYDTNVGERGVRLSGGQRQRIGIARALYKQADIIIFDEATSALDNATERSVINAIEALSEDLTILIIAHRLSTIENCNIVLEIKNGGVNYVKISNSSKGNACE